MPSNITAKVRCYAKADAAEGYTTLSFTANYADDKGNLINQDWAYATPHLSVSMTVNAEAAKQFEEGASYTLTFAKEAARG